MTQASFVLPARQRLQKRPRTTRRQPRRNAPRLDRPRARRPAELGARLPAYGICRVSPLSLIAVGTDTKAGVFTPSPIW